MEGCVLGTREQKVLVADSQGLVFVTAEETQCVVLGAVFVYTPIRHVCLRVLRQLVPTVSSVFHCCRCLLCPGKYLGLRR